MGLLLDREAPPFVLSVNLRGAVGLLRPLQQRLEAILLQEGRWTCWYGHQFSTEQVVVKHHPVPEG